MATFLYAGRFDAYICAAHSCSFVWCFNFALVILTPPQYNSSGTFRNVPLLLSHACPAAACFYGYEELHVLRNQVRYTWLRHESLRFVSVLQPRLTIVRRE